jgi:S1-C subfamily serine protease
MKRAIFLIAWLVLLFIVSPSIAADEEILKQKIAINFEKLIARSKIQEPSQEIVTRSPGRSKLIRDTSNGVVLVGTNDMIGSGVVISNKGLLITNWHVIENKSSVGIVFKQAFHPDKASLKKEDIFFAKVLKTDPIRDLALLQVISPHRDLTVLTLGSLPQIEVGQDVFAISHPEGLLWSYTQGVVSQIRPNYVMKTQEGTTHRATYIQTQAVISHGSSGGALFDFNGQLIGILVATFGPGLNFAIAVNEVQRFIMSALEKR